VNLLLWNIFLALSWIALTGRATPGDFFIAFIIGYVILGFIYRGETSNYFGKVLKAVWLVLFFIWELLISSLKVAYDVLTPTHYMRPGVIAVPLENLTNGEITILANMVSLTPGSLSLDVSSDKRTLFIHAMYIDEVELVRKRIKRFEQLILEVSR
jgi:multicomponent Na+:H+ antiporter subunit E